MTSNQPSLLRRTARRARRRLDQAREHLTTPRDLRIAVREAKKAREFMASAAITPNWSNAVVVQEALARGLQVSGDQRGRVQISDGHRTRYYDDGLASINQRMARQIVESKQSTSRLLHARGVRAAQSEVFGPDEAEIAWAWAEPLTPLVVKSASTGMGRLVRVNIRDRAEFKRAFKRIARESPQVMVEELVTGAEHRVLVVDGSMIAASRRVRAHVVGDGRTDVAGLVAAKNRRRVASPNPIHHRLRLNAAMKRELTRQGFKPTSVPQADQVVYLRSTPNPHTGGDAIDATDELSTTEVQFIEKAARTFNGLRVSGVDVMLPRDGQGTEPYVLGISERPRLSLHHFPWQGQVRNVARSVLDAMFPKTATTTDAVSRTSKSRQYPPRN